ncbi:esterase-like activity of phytase family protein [Glutamicibacter endophyticus]|uniref:esterase-like activity of phytase family protein n=1 Tax=Glutamicibacter endophyticus TaxID=1522174 RepID=UPI003AEF4AB3
MNRNLHPRVLAGALLTGSLALSVTLIGPEALAAEQQFFERTATYPVYQNHPEGESAVTAAEISAVSPDGKTLIYTDALARQIGFVDISNASAPQGLGTLSLKQLGNEEDEPTSVATHGEYVFVVVNTSASYAQPSGRVDVVRIADRSVVHSFELPGQPDSIAVSADGAFAAIAIENERDEEAGDGGLPQAPAGSIAILDLAANEPAQWSLREVPLTSGDPGDPQALPVLEQAGLDTPQDPEPEYVSINGQNQLAVSLQENNGVVLVDLPSGEITGAFSTGEVDVAGVDIAKDGQLDPSGSLEQAPREPDAIAWAQDRYLLTANEGDWKGGSRGFSVFDTSTGEVIWDAGNELERLALAQGLFPEHRAEKKGIEPEGLAVAEFNGVDYAFVAAERANFVAVYELSDPTQPRYVQSLPTTNGPEGVLPIPGRDLLAISSEVDEAEEGVRSSLNLFNFGAAQAAFPQLQADGQKVAGFGALSGLSQDPANADRLYAVNDNAYLPRIYSIDTAQSPALIDGSIPVTKDGAPAHYDLEGIAARAEGGFWAVHEGTRGPENLLLRLDAQGSVTEEVPLPQDVVADLGKQGLEGVTVRGADADEEVVFALQREVPGEDFVRIGRYRPADGDFAWFGYELEPSAGKGQWNGLSEITALPDGSLAVIERDNQVGEHAQLKAVYQVTLPEPVAGQVPMLHKKLAVDVMPSLTGDNGRVQEKLEGLGVTGSGQVYVVSDNDAVKDATGETVFAHLGAVEELFALTEQPAPSPSPSAEPTHSPEPSQSPQPSVSAEPSQSPERSSTPSSTASAPERDEKLADTGFAAEQLLGLGAAALLIGAVVAVAARMRRRH